VNATQQAARVTVAYATVKLLDPATGKWTVHGFPQGAVFPSSADPENVANLVRREYAEWVDPPASVPPESAPEPAPPEPEPAVKATPVEEAKPAAAKATPVKPGG